MKKQKSTSNSRLTPPHGQPENPCEFTQEVPDPYHGRGKPAPYSYGCSTRIKLIVWVCFALLAAFYGVGLCLTHR